MAELMTGSMWRLLRALPLAVTTKVVATADAFEGEGRNA